MKKQLLLIGLCVMIGSGPLGAQNKVAVEQVGQPLPVWQAGQLDIHQISTGQGNATFAILPDGTTLLIDAGAISPIDWQTNALRNLPRKPNASRQPGEWIARYVRKCLAFQSNPSIDYVLLTHFHDDHMGSPVQAPRKAGANYTLTGITEVAEYIPVRKILDRGWPHYDYPRSFVSDSMVVNYRRFLAWQIQKNGLAVERFGAGRTDQIRLVNRPTDYEPLFEVRNIAVNGDVWMGTGTRPLFPNLAAVPVAQYPTENMCSAALRIRYGAFDYFSGGDIPGVLRFGIPAWHDMESPIAGATGPVDVLLMNHHGHEDSQNGILLAKLQPRVLVIPVWHTSHPARSVMERVSSQELYAGERDVFATELLDETRAALDELSTRLKSTDGHVVVRVNAGGGSYAVFLLSDTDESQRVIARFGPYLSK